VHLRWLPQHKALALVQALRPGTVQALLQPQIRAVLRAQAQLAPARV
jgi:hypothetical protein